jgi:hypothetical protein
VAWLIVVAWLSWGHSVWRDETRALSLALEQPSFLGLFTNPPRDGHPLVWFTLLRSAYFVVGQYWVLKLLSVAIAAAACWLVLFKSPLPLLLRLLIIFSGIVIVDYAVVARNYGISFLLMLLFAHAFTRENRHPAAMGVCLFLLANTNVHSALLSIPLGALWIWDEAKHGRWQSAAAALFVMAAGLGLCFYSIYPSTNQLAIDDTPTSFSTIIVALLNPGASFRSLSFGLPAAAVTIILWIVILSLKRLPLILAAIAGTLALSLFFAVVYPGSHRHESLWIAFIVALMWIKWGLFGEALDRLGHIVLSLILAAQVGYGIVWAVNAQAHPYSRSADLALHVERTPCLREAIIVSDPDYMAEALPYYLGNPLYSVREQRFFKTLRFSADSKRDISLGHLLDVAQTLGSKHQRPVLILVETSLDRAKIATVPFYSLRITSDDLSRFRASTVQLADLRPAKTDEEYGVYLVDQQSACSGGTQRAS